MVSRLRVSRVSVLKKPASGRREGFSEFRICPDALKRRRSDSVPVCCVACDAPERKKSPDTCLVGLEGFKQFFLHGVTVPRVGGLMELNSIEIPRKGFL